MAAAEEPGLLQFAVKTSTGHETIVVTGLPTEAISDQTALASRSRFSIMSGKGMATAHRVSPIPDDGRPVVPVVGRIIPAQAYLVVKHLSDAADSLDTSDHVVRIPIVRRDLSKVGTDLEFQATYLTLADRDTALDDQSCDTLDYKAQLRFQCPNGQEWMGPHGDPKLTIYDDTA